MSQQRFELLRKHWMKETLQTPPAQAALGAGLRELCAPELCIKLFYATYSRATTPCRAATPALEGAGNTREARDAAALQRKQV